ncbi:hypothetical protein [Poseidonocella sp. HB161398]|uniref:hypothetical protein n=1 Tax=Poseidonocella sp. HB161398 TaxID=2320855 RepID=UPI0011096983|nr:hypothetical protein [Poseidonocella sp. HB161398]
MNPHPLSNATRVLATAQPEYQPLQIHDHPLGDGDNLMVSLWQPSAEERAAIAAGAPVRLSILGTVHPPVLIEVEEVEGQDLVDRLSAVGEGFLWAVHIIGPDEYSRRAALVIAWQGGRPPIKEGRSDG